MPVEPRVLGEPRVEMLPETAGVHWRPRVTEDRLRRLGRLWTLTTAAHVVPFLAAAGLLIALDPRTLPVALVLVAHAWVIPELYARRGANVLRAHRRGAAEPERRALGLLGDLVDHDARDLLMATGLVVERGGLGTWIVGETGALLLRGRRVYCYCVRVDGRVPGANELPSGDRVAHLLLALRADEHGFATVANLSFSGARWRLRRRIREPMRPALDAAVKGLDTRSRVEG
jgi:hypothetical protein